jgi:hypothetical protein
MAHTLNDNFVTGDAVKDSIGIGADGEPSHAWKVGRLPRVRVLRQQEEKGRNPLAHAVCALGRFRLDII